PRYNRDRLRYPSDLTDEEWTLVEPLIPPGKRGGGKRRVIMREVVNGVMYILSTGHDYLSLWNWDSTLDRIHHALYVKCREKAEREGSPTACIIDSQSVKSAEKGGLASIRPALMRASCSKARSGTSWSTRRGLLLHSIVTAADVQDRDGGIALLATLFGLFPYL